MRWTAVILGPGTSLKFLRTRWSGSVTIAETLNGIILTGSSIGKYAICSSNVLGGIFESCLC